MPSEKNTQDKWHILLLPNPSAEAKTVQELASDTWQQHQEGRIRCDSCNTHHDVFEETKIVAASEAVIFGFPRGAAVRAGRQIRNHHPVVCEESIVVADKTFYLRALVEHLAASRSSSDSGHYVSWLRQAGSWLRCDDALVDSRAHLAETVATNVAMAFYSTQMVEEDIPVHGFVVPFSGLPILVCCFWFHVCFGFRENRKTSFFPTVCLPVLRLGKTGGLQGYCMANEASHHSLCLCIGRYTSGCRRPIHIHPHVY